MLHRENSRHQAFCEAASLLYGEGWQSKVARFLNVRSKRVREWAAGSKPVPVNVLVTLCEQLKRTQDCAETAVRRLTKILEHGDLEQ